MALSTATFAWYSAGQSSVQANQFTVTAAAPTNADLRIADSSYDKTTFEEWNTKTAPVTLTASTVELIPTAVVANAAPDTLTKFNAVTKVNAVLDADNTANFGTVSENGGNMHTYTFKVANLSTIAKSVKGSATITGTNASLLNYALFVGDKLINGNGSWYTAAPATGDAITSYTGTALVDQSSYTTNPLTEQLAAATGTVTPSTVTLFVWLDGSYTAGDYAETNGGSFNISVTIQAA